MDLGIATLDPARDEAGQGPAPHLVLDGFSGPLDHLLTLARARNIDIGRLSLAALVDQLAAALRQATPATPLGQKGDWVVMAAWLVQQRSLLLLPAQAPARQAAEAEADQLRDRLVALQGMRALAGWMEARPQLGRDVFARGRPEAFGVTSDTAPALDAVEFLWASLALFDDDIPGAETTTVYRPLWHRALYTVAAARDRILRRLADTPDGVPLEQLLPDPEEAAEPAPLAGLRRRSAWSSTLIASLELARQGEVVVGQGGEFQTIHVAYDATRGVITTGAYRPIPSGT